MHGGTWPIRIAMVGLGMLGWIAIVVAPASAPLSAIVFNGWWLSLTSILTQILLVGLCVALLSIGLDVGSRLAHGVAFVIGLVPCAAWVFLLASGHEAALAPRMILVAIPSLLVLTGLTVAWQRTSRSPRRRAGLSR